MKQITKNSDLEINKYYWLVNKNFNNKFIDELIEDVSTGLHTFKNNRTWAHDENSQALKKYDIYGPVEEPDLNEG